MLEDEHRVRLRQGGSFVAYARQYSQASTAAVGGDLGWVRLEQLPTKRTDAELVFGVTHEGARTVVDLTTGSGLEFEPREARELKGVPGTWPIFAARSDELSATP